jgi:hypothetical protein
MGAWGVALHKNAGRCRGRYRARAARPLPRDVGSPHTTGAPPLVPARARDHARRGAVAVHHDVRGLLNLSLAAWMQQYYLDPDCAKHHAYELYWVRALKPALLAAAAAHAGGSGRCSDGSL